MSEAEQGGASTDGAEVICTRQRLDSIEVRLAAPTLQAEPLARLEWSDDDGAWVIVNDRTMTVRLLEDRQRRT